MPMTNELIDPNIPQHPHGEEFIRAAEEIQSQLGEHLDGMDPFLVLSIIADAQGDDIATLLASHLGKDLIRATQSNPKRAFNALRRMGRLEEMIAENA
jgi:hypothetical protein